MLCSVIKSQGCALFFAKEMFLLPSNFNVMFQRYVSRETLIDFRLLQS